MLYLKYFFNSFLKIVTSISSWNQKLKFKRINLYLLEIKSKQISQKGINLNLKETKEKNVVFRPKQDNYNYCIKWKKLIAEFIYIFSKTRQLYIFKLHLIKSSYTKVQVMANMSFLSQKNLRGHIFPILVPVRLKGLTQK